MSPWWNLRFCVANSSLNNGNQAGLQVTLCKYVFCLLFGGIPIVSFIFTKALPFQYQYTLGVKHKGLQCPLGEYLEWHFILPVAQLIYRLPHQAGDVTHTISQSYYADIFIAKSKLTTSSNHW